jgi:tetratricopeptide (TPR) repeat protein
MRHVERALEIEPENARALAEKGDLLYRRWSYTRDPDLASRTLVEAEESLRAAVALDRTLVQALSILSQILLSKGEFREAELMGKRAEEADVFLENVSTISNDLAIVYLNLGDEREALDHCLQVQRASPGPVGLECELEVWAWSEDLPLDLDRARAVADTLLTRMDSQPTFRARILFDLAGVFARASLLDSASVYQEEGEGCCPEEEPLWQQAAAEVRFGSSDEAISILRRLLEKEPNGGLGYLERRVFQPLSGHPEFEELRSRYTRRSP